MAEMRQRLIMCVETLKKLNGSMPSTAELYRALGNEYAEVLSEFVNELALAAA